MTNPPTLSDSTTSAPPPPKRPWTILGRLAQAVREQNWFAVVLEVVIVVVGVLIALAANDWADGRQMRKAEIQALRELRAALVNDLDESMGIDVTAQGLDQVVRSLTILQEHLGSGLPYEDSLARHFAYVDVISIGVRDLSAYETLKARGMGTITNDSLRIAITRLYGMSYPLLEKVQEAVNFDVRARVSPFMSTRFRDLVPLQRATPVDYASLRESTEFRNLLTGVVAGQSILLTMHNDVAAEIRALIAHVDAELIRLT